MKNNYIYMGVEINELASICGQTIFKIIPDSEKFMPTSIMLKQLILFYLDFFTHYSWIVFGNAHGHSVYKYFNYP